jgi:hypothetical protein
MHAVHWRRRHRCGGRFGGTQRTRSPSLSAVCILISIFVCVQYASFIAFEIMLCTRQAAVHAALSDATVPIPSIRNVCSPLLLCCVLLAGMSARYARLQFAHRTSTYQFQMDRPIELTDG